jgi:hypothetical protein
MQQRFANYSSQHQEMVFAGVDVSIFKEGVEIQQVGRLINLVLEGLLNQLMPTIQKMEPAQSLKLIEQMTSEVETYFEMIKKGVCR